MNPRLYFLPLAATAPAFAGMADIPVKNFRKPAPVFCTYTVFTAGAGISATVCKTEPARKPSKARRVWPPLQKFPNEANAWFKKWHSNDKEDGGLVAAILQDRGE